MSVREAELALSQRAQRSHQKQVKRRRSSWRASGSARAQPLSLVHDSQVLTFHEWCQLNRISERTGRRILNSGTGPVVTQLSPKRIGITVGADKAWKAARARPTITSTSTSTST
jgi:hypothetical protein